MSIQANFEGASFVRPSGATKVDTSAFAGLSINGAGVLALIGTALDGEPRVRKEWDDLRDLRAEFYDGDILDAVRTAFNASLDSAVSGKPTKIHTYKTNNSTKSTLTVDTTVGPLPGSVQLTSSGPYTITPGAAVDVSTFDGGPEVLAFAGTSAIIAGAGAIGMPLGAQTLVVRVNGATVQYQQEVIFTGASITTTEVIAEINAVLQGAFAVEDAGIPNQINLESTIFGTGSRLEVMAATTAVGLALAGTAVGTGVAANLFAMTESELKTLVEASGFMSLDLTTTPPTLSTTQLGAAALLTIVGGAPASVLLVLGLIAAAYAGAAAGASVDVVRFDSKGYGTPNNGIRVTAVDPTPVSRERILTIDRLIDGVNQVQTSPTLAGVRRFTIQHVGVGASCTMTTTSTSLVLDSADNSEDLTLLYTDYPTLDVLLQQIDANAAYTVTNEIVDSAFVDPADLDWLAAVDVKTFPVDVFADVYDVVDWVNREAEYLVATRLVTGATIFDAFATPRVLLGATNGTEASSNYTDGLNALANVHIDRIVPLVSSNRTTGGNNVIFSTVAVAVAAHCKDKTEVSEAQDERRCWIGAKGTKAQLLTIRDALVPYGQFVTLCADRQRLPSGRSGTLAYLDEWSTAVMGAAMRGGAQIGEPLVNKSLASQGVQRDWNPDTPGEIQDLLRKGLTLTKVDRTDGLIRFERVLTLYPADNDGLREESIYSGLLAFAYDWRTQVTRRFLGKKGTLANATTIGTFTEEILALYGPQEANGQDFFINTQDQVGQSVNYYRNLFISIGKSPYPSDAAVMSVEVTAVNGINFIFQTVAAQPGTISVAL